MSNINKIALPNINSFMHSWTTSWT